MQRFSKISEQLAVKMSDLKDSSKWLFVLLLMGRKRDKHTNEPYTKEFEITYLDFRMYGWSRKNYDRSIKELEAKQYVQVSGKQRSKKCKLLKW